MRFLLLVLGIVFAILFEGTSNARDGKPKDCAALPHLLAISAKTEEVEFSYYWKQGSLKIPNKIRGAIDQIALKNFEYFRSLNKEDKNLNCDDKLSDYYGSLYKVKVDRNLDLYVFNELGRYGYANYVLILHDHIKDEISLEPVKVYAKWYSTEFAGIETGPLVSFVDINGDGKKELQVFEQFHNGSVYNALGHHYLELNNLEMKRVLVVEYLSLGFGEGHVARTIKAISENQLLFTFKHLDEQDKVLEEKSVLLERNKRFEPFQMKKSEDDLPGWAITGCEMSGNKFLAKGCNFQY